MLINEKNQPCACPRGHEFDPLRATLREVFPLAPHQGKMFRLDQRARFYTRQK